jgi:hypothetical protein
LGHRPLSGLAIQDGIEQLKTRHQHDAFHAKPRNAMPAVWSVQPAAAAAAALIPDPLTISAKIPLSPETEHFSSRNVSWPAPSSVSLGRTGVGLRLLSIEEKRRCRSTSPVSCSPGVAVPQKIANQDKTTKSIRQKRVLIGIEFKLSKGVNKIRACQT